MQMRLLATEKKERGVLDAGIRVTRPVIIDKGRRQRPDIVAGGRRWRYGRAGIDVRHVRKRFRRNTCHRFIAENVTALARVVRRTRTREAVHSIQALASVQTPGRHKSMKWPTSPSSTTRVDETWARQLECNETDPLYGRRHSL